MVIKFQDKSKGKTEKKEEVTEGFYLRKNDPVTRRLLLMLKILGVLLVAAVIWQQYVNTHTYKKGELVQKEQGTHKQRLKYLDDDQELLQETENGTETELQTETHTEAQTETQAEAQTEAAAVPETKQESEQPAQKAETDAEQVADDVFAAIDEIPDAAAETEA